MPVNKKVYYRPHVCVSIQAHKHLSRIVSAMKKQGLVENNTKYLSELILSQPIPNGHVTQAPAAEIHKINEEAKA